MDNKVPTRKKKMPLSQNSGKITRKTKTPPPSEHDLFTRLCASQLGVECVKEYKFHPTRRWRFDFAIPQYKIAIEIDGGVWTYGRHNRSSGYIADMEKFNAAASLGWVVLKFTPDEQYTKKTFDLIRQTIKTIEDERTMETHTTL